jgi:hypothetical protein
VAIVSVRTLPDVELGHRFVLLVDIVEAAGRRVFFMAQETRIRASRTPTARERAEAQRHAPTSTTSAAGNAKREQVPDGDLLDERAALEAARLEQQRTPPDLVNVAA